MDNQLQEIVSRNLEKEWEIAMPGLVTRETILLALEARISALISKAPETFFQLMYRLDIPEKQLNTILYDMDAPAKIAVMVYERQLQKAESRQKNRGGNIDIDEDLNW
jgi:hypothetical protein